ncbi:hypothetical protein A7U60_g2368 [Sanghuangporus baumii]|uniref:Uncharacterized protein n=1 Tax=Sanghuangporus baumii TaxID=108892 RepID=A0A9Q5I2D5_SANBA|nr:hypothetical protein A7U60_g2368 [Sanghuangporus baumii]
MAYQLPSRGDKRAPTFDGSEPKELPRFFEDIAEIARQAAWNDRDHIRKFLYYAKTDIAELWETTDETNDPNPDVEMVKREIIALYPSLTAGKCYSKGELEHLVVERAKKEIKN